MRLDESEPQSRRPKPPRGRSNTRLRLLLAANHVKRCRPSDCFRELIGLGESAEVRRHFAGEVVPRKRERDPFGLILAVHRGRANGLIEPLHAGSMEWRHETGIAAQNGVQAALLARRGLRAAATAFEGKFGFWRAFGGATRAPASATSDLGRTFAIMKTFHKPYPTASEYTWNSAMYVTHQLAVRNSIDFRDVNEISVTVMTKMLSYPGLAFAGPYDNIDQAIASKPFAIAAIVRNHGFTSEVYRTQLRDPELFALARRVRVNGSDGWNDEWRCHVLITLKDGKRFEGDERMVDRSIFYPDREGMLRKFDTMIAETPFRPRAKSIAVAVFDLESAVSIAPLAHLLAAD
jgi:hypothetical protein